MYDSTYHMRDFLILWYVSSSSIPLIYSGHASCLKLRIEALLEIQDTHLASPYSRPRSRPKGQQGKSSTIRDRVAIQNLSPSLWVMTFS